MGVSVYEYVCMFVLHVMYKLCLFAQILIGPCFNPVYPWKESGHISFLGQVKSSSVRSFRGHRKECLRGGYQLWFKGCWWSAWVGRILSFQLEMRLYLCPFAGQWCFFLRPVVLPWILACSLELVCAHWKNPTHLSLLFVTTKLKKICFLPMTVHAKTEVVFTHDGYIVSFFRWLGFCSHRQPSNWQQIVHKSHVHKILLHYLPGSGWVKRQIPQFSLQAT